MFPLVAFVLLLAAPKGDVYVADAGTLVMSGTAVRLEGIAVPPPNSLQGQAATEMLRAFVEGKLVTCQMQGAGIASFASGTCQADGEDIGAALIASGHARECAIDSDDAVPACRLPQTD